MPTSTTKLSLGLAFLAATSLTTAYPLYTFNGSPSALLARDDNSTLQSCLANSGGYDLSYSTSSDYTALSTSYNSLFDYKPLVVAVPSSEAEISAIVQCVSAEGGKQKLSPRSGGHSYESYSLGGQDGSVVVDLQNFNTIDVNQTTKTAIVGAGVRLGPLAQSIWDQGNFSLPHGTCPYVGVSGHALGGGFGFPTRAWGFLLDRIVEMRMIDVNGTIQNVNNETNTDLWWALRGAGSNNFGIVTQFTFSLLDAPTSIINYAYSYKTNEDCANAVVALQSMTLATNVDQGLAPEFGGELLIAGSAAGDFDGNACQLSGQHISTSRADHDALISRFNTLAGITPASTTVTEYTSWLESLENIMGSLNTSAPITQDQFYAKSLVQPTLATYNYSSALALVDKLNGYAGLQGTGNSVSFDFLGPLSFPNNVNASDSAFNAHTASFIYQFYSYGFPSNDNSDGQQQVWNAFDDLVETAKDSDSAADWGAYVNYVDARQQDWGSAYYGQGLARLKAMKETWDAEGVFWFPQGLASA
ncbi:FAD linked oxidase, N-terminal [Kalmanozyma brasiliensis GHG001]|uniref:FAD-binding PCMH-type domain-containing protein n=1 Tax=Kalmanozyma brasiliensis (strain GHG001) TaxID=1365824 RepID=V5ESG9_KALBG|nr:FAD linked oxidase, N-terminal [Kalmanozyma brasiliensis GHG001]EST04859.1 FAD linked oxidase, N-terminal [Kalmanozyma brasiliensis GHG001]